MSSAIITDCKTMYVYKKYIPDNDNDNDDELIGSAFFQVADWANETHGVSTSLHVLLLNKQHKTIAKFYMMRES